MNTNHIILNGQQNLSAEISRQTAELISIPATPDWEKELYLFLTEWFSDSEFVLAQTSGSTGEPKQIQLPKSVMVKSAERTIEYFGLKSTDRLLLSLPCRYIAGKMMAVRAIVGQMNLITVDPAGDFEILATEKFDFGAMVPTQIFKILDQPSGRKKLQNIENLLIGGSAISTSLENKISTLPTRIVSTYGMTETASHIAIRELSGDRKSEYYHCLSDISVSLNENDCLQIHLPEMAVPLQTNDLAELKSDNSFRILGRADSVIISGGIKHSPEAIERKLEQIIHQRFIISSFPDEKLGEKLVLIIEGKPFNTDYLEQKIATILPPFEQPKTIVFLDQFQKTTSGKVIRKEVKKLL